MESIDDLLKKWKEAQDMCVLYEKKKTKYRDRIEKLLKETGEKSFDNDEFRVTMRSHNREMITKKDVPKNVWEQYSVTHHVEYLNISSKKKPPHNVTVT